VRIDLEGTDRLTAVLKRAEMQNTDALKQAMSAEGAATMVVAKNLTPWQFGALRDSGKVEEPKETREGVDVQLTFGGPSAPYALYVHERVDVFHKAPTQAKFLETAMLQRAPEFNRNLAKALVRILRGA